MPYKDPEKKNENARKQYHSNLEKSREYNRNKMQRYRADEGFKEHERELRWLWRQHPENKEKLSEQAKIKYQHYDSEWHAKNRIRVKKWRNANPEKVKVWYDANLEKYKTYNNNRRARIKGNGGTFTFKELNEQFERQEGFCYYCGELLYKSFDSSVHIDHMTPISRGGSNDISNIALSCAACNLKKHTQTAEEFLQEMNK